MKATAQKPKIRTAVTHKFDPVAAFSDWLEHKPTPSRTIIWDWKEQPDWDEINQALAAIPRARCRSVQTDGDWYAIVVVPVGTRTRKAQSLYDAEMRAMAGEGHD